MHLVGRLGPEVDDRAVAGALRRAGVEAPALSTYYREAPGARGLLLGYAGVPEAEVTLAIARLAAVLEAAPAGYAASAAE
jgi:GntR family transcriptional regulator/MocR family aminotransferase